MQTFCTLEASTEFSNTKQNLRENVFIEQHFAIAKPGFIKNLHGEKNKWKLFPMQNSFNIAVINAPYQTALFTYLMFWFLKHGFVFLPWTKSGWHPETGPSRDIEYDHWIQESIKHIPKNLKGKDRQRQLLYYVTLIRACNKVLYKLVYIGKKFVLLKKNICIQ